MVNVSETLQAHGTRQGWWVQLNCLSYICVVCFISSLNSTLFSFCQVNVKTNIKQVLYFFDPVSTHPYAPICCLKQVFVGATGRTILSTAIFMYILTSFYKKTCLSRIYIVLEPCCKNYFTYCSILMYCDFLVQWTKHNSILETVPS